MTPLRRRMIDALVLHGKAARTQEAYARKRLMLARSRNWRGTTGAARTR